MDCKPQLGDLLRWSLPAVGVKPCSIIVDIDYQRRRVKILEGSTWYETIEAVMSEYTLVQRLDSREDHD